MPLRYLILADLPEQSRRRLRVEGEDAHRFLQAVLSADLNALEPKMAIPAAFLTVKGKIISELIVLGREDGGIDLLLPEAEYETIREQLEHHVIMDDVCFERDEVLTIAAVLGELGGFEAGPELESYRTRYPIPGTLLIGPQAAIDAGLSAGEKVGEEAWLRARIEGGVPAWGFEVEAGRFPPEVGFVGAVSYDKGCYLGQEPLARIHARGQVNWVMVRVASDLAPKQACTPRGSITLGTEDADEIGRWTSWVHDEKGGASGLAIVKRKVATPGTSLRGPEGASVQVVSEAIGDDPGIQSARG